MESTRAIYIITEETRCPLYNAGEELAVDGIVLTTPRAKPTCLTLANNLRLLLAVDPATGPAASREDKLHSCDGCVGVVRFERKQEKGYATLPMKLLAASRRREQHEHFEELIHGLRATPLFAPLPDNDLEDLACILQLREYQPDEAILTRGESGARLCILLAGQVEVLSERGKRLSLLKPGEVFGEMSLLGGTPVSSTVRTLCASRLAELSSKDFRHLLSRHLALQLFFYRLLAERLNESNRLRTSDMGGEMSGLLDEMALLDLLQLCHSESKTGCLQLDYANSTGAVFFHAGEIVSCHHGKTTGLRALQQMLRLTAGRFSYVSGLDEEHDSLSPLDSFANLLMASLQLDEEASRQ